MHRSIPSHRSRLLTALALIALLPAALLAPSRVEANASSFANVSRWVTLSGSVTSQIAHAQKQHSVSATRKLSITVTLRLRNQNTLNTVLQNIYNPHSISYHHFLTSAQFKHEFAPTDASRAAVVNWLSGQGLKLTSVAANGLVVSAHGSAAAMEKTFQTHLFTFNGATGNFVANSDALHIPGVLASDVLSVSGLSTATPWHVTGSLQTRAVSSPSQGLQPADIQQLYNLDPLLAQKIDGSGQTIAIAAFGDYSDADIAAFDSQYNLPTNVTRINVSDGQTSGAPLGSNNGQDETEADIELLQSVAPNAQILVYEAPNSDAGAIALYNRIVSDNRASIVSNSWGGAESLTPAGTTSAVHAAMQEAAAQGQAVFSSSGDDGAYDAASQSRSQRTTLEVDYPASDPWVTGVGGTTLESNGTSYGNEIAWSTSSQSRSPAGSGGGLSTLFSEPSYQSGPGVSNSYSNGMRQVPDVAADADPNTGYAVYTISSRDIPGWSVMGGTSASAPMWAGFTALVIQSMGNRVGFLNPTLYELGQKASAFAQSPFHDVTTGDNLYYPATQGWDFATGWGSFNGAAFVDDVKTLPQLPTTSIPLPTATASPTPSPTPQSVKPTLTINKILLLHRVAGKLAVTTKLKVGETGTLVILYTRKNASSLLLSGTITVRENGKVVRVIATGSTTYQGRPALTATLKFTNAKRAGTLSAHVTLSLGAISAVLNHVFKLSAR